jgi:hypothetical protein
MPWWKKFNLGLKLSDFRDLLPKFIPDLFPVLF